MARVTNSHNDTLPNIPANLTNRHLSAYRTYRPQKFRLPKKVFDRNSGIWAESK